MDKKYFVVINDIITDKELNNFTKAISSNFANIKAGEFLFLIVAPENESLKTIYDKIAAKFDNDEVSFVIVQFEFWYGKIFMDAFDWLDEKFPDKKLIRE